MIIGFHIIFGFWLPNDPRGSWSDFVGSWDLFRYGRATKTSERQSLANRKHDRQSRLAAKRALSRPPVLFSGIQARAVARGFAAYAQKANIPIWACAVLPDHIHLVIGRAHIHADQLAIQLKSAATQTLLAESVHPFGGENKCFAQGQWVVFLDPPDVPRAIRYVEENPLKEGKPRQRWTFITPYDC